MDVFGKTVDCVLTRDEQIARPSTVTARSVSWIHFTLMKNVPVFIPTNCTMESVSLGVHMDALTAIRRVVEYV